eukprot:4310307-Pyramimonas_sp.AAC.1
MFRENRTFTATTGCPIPTEHQSPSIPVWDPSQTVNQYQTDMYEGTRANIQRKPLTMFCVLRCA